MDANALLDLAPHGPARHGFIGVLASTLAHDGKITPESWAEAARKAVEYEATTFR